MGQMLGKETRGAMQKPRARALICNGSEKMFHPDGRLLKSSRPVDRENQRNLKKRIGNLRLKTSVYIATSLDGFIARENGDLDWLPGPNTENEGDYGYGAFMSTVDFIVMGRHTFEKALTFGAWALPAKTRCGARQSTSEYSFEPC